MYSMFSVHSVQYTYNNCLKCEFALNGVLMSTVQNI